MEFWTPEHIKTLIPSLVIMLIVSIVLKLTIGKKELSVRMIPFQLLAVIILLIEFGKQTVSLSRGYDLYHLPFHFCSLFIFMLPLMAFYKGKYRNTICSITTALCASVFILMMIYPSLIYSAYDISNYSDNYMCFHTVTFHNIVIMEFLLILFLNLNVSYEKERMKPILLFVLVYNLIAAAMAYILKTNYNNLYECNVPPLESLRQTVENAIGRAPAQIIYVIIVIIVDLIFVSMSYGLYRLCALALCKKRKAKAADSIISTIF